MTNTPSRLAGALLLALAALAGGMYGCGGDDDDPGAAPTSNVRDDLAAARPAWFPATFPLPAQTTVVSEQGTEDAGGTVQFRAPVPLSRAILILDNNLETESHGYTILSREASETGATYAVESEQYTGSVNVEPAGDSESLINVELAAK